MNRCRYTVTSKLGLFSAILLYPAIGLVVLIVGVYILSDICISQKQMNLSIMVELFISFVAFCISFLLFYLSIKCYIMESRKYAITPTGVVINNFGQACYSWDAICEIAIIAYAASASLQNYQTVICCFLKPPNQYVLSRLLKSYVYGAINTDKFVIIDYHPNTLDKIRDNYPRVIVDYREKQLGL